jgi:hypothetical protein
MCRNHHDLLEMALIESLPLRQLHNLQALRNIALRFVLPDIIDSFSQY